MWNFALETLAAAAACCGLCVKTHFSFASSRSLRRRWHHTAPFAMSYTNLSFGRKLFPTNPKPNRPQTELKAHSSLASSSRSDAVLIYYRNFRCNPGVNYNSSLTMTATTVRRAASTSSAAAQERQAKVSLLGSHSEPLSHTVLAVIYVLYHLHPLEWDIRVLLSAWDVTVELCINLTAFFVVILFKERAQLFGFMNHQNKELNSLGD